MVAIGSETVTEFFLSFVPSLFLSFIHEWVTHFFLYKFLSLYPSPTPHVELRSSTLNILNAFHHPFITNTRARHCKCRTPGPAQKDKCQNLNPSANRWYLTVFSEYSGLLARSHHEQSGPVIATYKIIVRIHKTISTIIIDNSTERK